MQWPTPVSYTHLDVYKRQHLKRVAVPVRLSLSKIGEANILCARTRPKLIGGERAIFSRISATASCICSRFFSAMMLDDDDFVDAIKEIINSQKKCAEYAVKTEMCIRDSSCFAG